MTTTWPLVALLSLTAVVVTSGLPFRQDAYMPVRELSPSCYQCAAVTANSKFAIDLYKKIGSSSSGQNMIFSPFSVSAALAMTYGGAIGTTSTQMSQVLRFNYIPWYCNVHETFQSLMNLLPNYNTLNTANKIFIDNSFTLKPSYVTLTTTYYLAPAQVLNIHGNPSGSTATINNWVATQTDQQITNLLSPLDPRTALVLVNAITFKDKWLKPFGMSSNGAFHVSSSQTVQTCKMQMSCGPASRRHGNIPALDSQILELQYKSNEVSMYILRPNQIGGLAFLESNLNLGTLNAAIADMTTKQVNVILPKFSLSQNIDLKVYLQAMGMTNVFDQSAADLSGIGTGSGDLYVDFVQHMAIIKVDEQGTEASAATAVGVCYARRRRDTPVPFDVDRPFLFILREKRCGSILFMGRLTTPGSTCAGRFSGIGRVSQRQQEMFSAFK
ncbi:Serpin B8 [Lamellibrachia satsuma]|nr:Serpin B8 [Lamellibrachia satsuma]